MMQWLTELNQEQRAAVEARDGPVLIVAGPGTGKTKTLTARLAYLLASGRARPSEILALTFTKKSAEEMKGRVTALMQQKTAASQPYIATFHALCNELVGNDTPFITEPARIQLIKGLRTPTELKGFSVRERGLLISRAKNMAEKDAVVQRLTHAYDTVLHEQGLRDFDDLLVDARELLRNDPAAQAELRSRYRYILVDEFQDTNALQYELLHLLRGTDNIFVIGDPNQSIYGFRGASGSIFDRFRTDFPDHTAVTLTANYRSTPEIVQLANDIFTIDFPLQAQTRRAGRVRAMELFNEYSEAHWVMAEIQKAIGGGDMLQAVSDDDSTAHRALRDFAILYRSRSAAMAMQKCIDESGLPYQIVGEGSPYEQPQAQALIALLRTAATGEAVPLEGFGAGEAHLLEDMLAQDAAAAPRYLAERLCAVLGFEQTPRLQQFINTLVRFDTVAQAVAYFDMLAETHYYDPRADVITLLTIHAAKGLEFPHVFLIGAEEGILPHTHADPDEERRLFYVAVTRAREVLESTHCRHRGGKPAEVSRFIHELRPAVLPQLVDPNIEDDIRRARQRAIKRSQQSLF